MSWHIFGADSIVVPVLSGGDGQKRGRREGGLCDGPGSSCGGRGARGLFASPVDPGAVLCPGCMLAVRQRGLG